MTADVQSILTPNEADMREHVEHLFGGFLDGFHDGRIELAWTDAEPDASGRYPLRHAETYATDDIDALIARAVEVNSRPRTNVYIGACLRHPNTPPVGRCNDDDVYCAPAYWSDLDDRDANDHAKQRFAGAPPSLVVRTGDHPHWRNQLWWRLVEPVTDHERVRAAVSGIAAQMGGDGTVANPSRVMRLAGTIAWDQKPGRRPELTRIVRLKSPGLDAYLPDHVERAYPPLFSLPHIKAARAAHGPNAGVVRAKNGLGLSTGKVIDGRERHMVNVICARLIDYCGMFERVPTAEELFDYAWDAYERSTDLSRAGRGRDEFIEKCRSTMRRFEQGKIRGAEDLKRAIASYATKREARQHNLRHESAFRQDDDDEFAAREDIFEFLDIAGIKSIPDARWIVRDLVPEDGLGFIYGPPGHGKTFVALDLALHISYGALAWWWGKKIDRSGLVLYVAREGLAGLKNRIEAWQRSQGIADDNAPFALVRSSINFMSEADIGKLVRTIEAAKDKLKAEPALIFVDTVSRVLPGADENLQKEMTLFVAACDVLRDRFKATVIGVHHAGKSGDMRGSTVLKGAGDFVIKVEKEDAESTDSGVKFTAEKIKDAEDGWTKGVELAPVEWVQDGVIDGERKSLVAKPVEGNGPAQKRTDGWPDKETCRRILKAIGDAWEAKAPWSPHHQAKAFGKHAPTILAMDWKIPPKIAVEMIETWQRRDVLRVELCHSDTKIKGLKVIGSID